MYYLPFELNQKIVSLIHKALPELVIESDKRWIKVHSNPFDFSIQLENIEGLTALVESGLFTYLDDSTLVSEDSIIYDLGPALNPTLLISVSQDRRLHEKFLGLDDSVYEMAGSVYINQLTRRIIEKYKICDSEKNFIKGAEYFRKTLASLLAKREKKHKSKAYEMDPARSR